MDLLSRESTRRRWRERGAPVTADTASGSDAAESTLDTARLYLDLDWMPIPVLYRQKKSTIHGWPDLRLNDLNLSDYFDGSPQNIGVILGEPSGDLTDVNLDCSEAIQLAPQFLPPTLSFGRPSKPKSHWLFTAKGAETERFSDPIPDEDSKHKTLVELRSTGSQTVFPGSTHVGGEPITWTAGKVTPLTVIAANDLHNRVVRLAVASLIARRAPAKLDAYQANPEHLPEGLPPAVSKRAAEWLGLSTPDQERKRGAPVKNSRLKVAAVRYNNEHPADWPAPGAGTCPVCHHNACFGRLKDSTDRWCCFSAGHPVGCGLRGKDCWTGDALDLAAHAAGCTPKELLESEGYLAPVKPSLAESMVGIVEPSALLVDERGKVFARVPVGEHHELLSVRSRRFRQWLAERVHESQHRVPGSEAIASALTVIEGQAHKDAQRTTLWNRVARGPDGAIWLDMADPQSRAVRVDAKGWGVVANPPPLFRRFSHQRALPEPVHGGDAAELEDLLNLSSDADRILFGSSLVVALVPDIPQPILIVHGPQGSAKTSAAKIRRAIVDPSAVPTVAARRDNGELVQALDHHYMPVFDNLSTLSDWQSDLFCQASTGGGFTKRELYSDEDDVLFSFRRPLVLTGINLPSVAPDLLDRALLIRLERIAPDKRKEEAQLWTLVERAHPSILGGILDALSRALRLYDKIKVPRPPRLADFTRFGAAAAEALGYGAKQFIEAMRENVARQVEEVTSDDPVALAVRAFARDQAAPWAGTASELLMDMAEFASTREEGWPKRAAELGRRLNVLRAPLADLGLRVWNERSPGGDRTRLWHVATDPAINVPTNAVPPVPPVGGAVPPAVPPAVPLPSRPTIPGTATGPLGTATGPLGTATGTAKQTASPTVGTAGTANAGPLYTGTHD